MCPRLSYHRPVCCIYVPAEIVFFIVGRTYPSKIYELRKLRHGKWKAPLFADYY